MRAVVQEHGVLALLLTLAEALYLPWAITAIDWIDNTQLLWPTVLLGLLTGIVLARLWPRDPRGFLVGTVLGWCTLFLAVGRVLPPPGRIFQDLGTILHWTLTRGAASPAGGNPIVDVGRSGFTALEVFSGQLASWWRLGGAGDAAVNDRIFLFLLATLCWISTVYLGWALYSRLAPLVSQLPLGAVLVTLVVLGGRGRTEVYLFVATALLLMLRVQVLGLTRRWLEQGLDFSSSVAGEIIATGVGFTVLVSVLALIIPAVPQNPLAVRFWELFNAPWSALEHNVGNAFFGVRHQVGGNNGLSLHLGGSLAFGPNQVVFYAATNEAPPPNPSQHDFGDSGYVEPEHYFIGATYATYDGRGWHVGPVAGTSRTGVPLGPNGAPEYLGVPSSSASVVQRPASTPIVSPQPNGSKVVQHIELKSDPGSLLYA
ncbi:MAG: transglutaminaseTgpA domain-containing protein, partial [Chloroflexi bacterium]|nr:transglutaminaseTgpA domain-containing protein [Chloroflexota bacterium]